MQKKLEQMFPGGQWTTGEKAWAVKDGMYFCHAAEIVDGEIVLTELGKRLLKVPEKSAEKAPEPVVEEKPAEKAPEPVVEEKPAEKQAFSAKKKTGLKV